MADGVVIVDKTPEESMDRLRMILAGANCEIVAQSGSMVRFRLTQSSAPLLMKTGVFWLRSCNGQTEIRYEVRLAIALRVWLTIIGVLFCWLIFPAILAYRTIVYHPRRFAENILAGI